MKLAAVLIGIALGTWVLMWVMNKALVQVVGKDTPNHHAIWFGITSILAILCWRLSYEATYRDMKAVDLGLMAFFISLARISLTNYFRAERDKVLPQTKAIPMKYHHLVVWEWRLANGKTVERVMIPSTWPPPKLSDRGLEGKVLLFKDGEPVILS